MIWRSSTRIILPRRAERSPGVVLTAPATLSSPQVPSLFVEGPARVLYHAFAHHVSLGDSPAPQKSRSGPLWHSPSNAAALTETPLARGTRRCVGPHPWPPSQSPPTEKQPQTKPTHKQAWTVHLRAIVPV